MANPRCTLDAVAKQRRRYNDARRATKDVPLSVPYGVDGLIDRERAFATLDPRDFDELNEKLRQETH